MNKTNENIIVEIMNKFDTDVDQIDKLLLYQKLQETKFE